MEKLKAYRWFLILLLVPLVAGCPWSTNSDNDPPPPPELIWKDLTSEDNLLYNFAQAWEEKNYEQYVLLLSDDFTFYFSPEDVEQNPDIPPSWGLEREKETMRVLFDDTNIERVDLTWVPGELEESELAQADTKVLVTNIYLEIDIRDPDDGQLWTNIIQGSTEFHFRKTEETTADGDTLWTIVVWKDLTAVAP